MKEKIMELKRTIMVLTTIIILALTSGIFSYVWINIYSDSIILPFYKKGNLLIMAIYVILLYAFTKVYSGYKVGYLRITEVIYSQVLSLLFTNIITYLQISLIGRRFLNIIPILIMTVVQILLITLWTIIANKIYYMLYPPRKMILVYENVENISIMKKMNSRKEKFNIVSKVSIKNGVTNICNMLSKYEAVVLSGINNEDRRKIVNCCYEKNIRVYIIPSVEDILVSNSETLHLFDTPILLLRNKGLSPENRFMKRLFDILLSLIAIILVSPIMIVVAISIKLYDGGPFLFKQRRLTIDGRVFEVYKFRSMIIDAEKDGVARLASKNDNRITPIGNFIRKVRLDELPQLFNILLGDMSIVGPRPERPEIAEQYIKSMPEFSYRLKVKAGLTGYAQILGKYNTTPRDKLLLDLMYIEKYSLFLDFKLILMTIKILFISESTEGVDEGSILAEEVVFTKDQD